MNNLMNKRVLLFAPELEKKEHRGIAVYTKSLINALFKAGAEVWLVSSLNTKNLRIDKFNKSSSDYIYASEILQSFFIGNDNNMRHCVQAYKDDVCTSGDIYKRMDDCLIPKLNLPTSQCMY